jgi:hypothetical protein
LDRTYEKKNHESEGRAQMLSSFNEEAGVLDPSWSVIWLILPVVICLS